MKKYKDRENVAACKASADREKETRIVRILIKIFQRKKTQK